MLLGTGIQVIIAVLLCLLLVVAILVTSELRTVLAQLRRLERGTAESGTEAAALLTPRPVGATLTIVRPRTREAEEITVARNKIGMEESMPKETTKSQSTAPAQEVIAYCMHCRAKKTIKDVKIVTMKNGKQAQKGSCSVCNGPVFKIGGV